MGSVVSFPKKEEPRETWAEGKAVCLACKHEWRAAAPIPVVDGLECPACGLLRGQYRYPFDIPPGHAAWTCNCGSDLCKLGVRPDNTEYLLCIGCGTAKGVIS